IALLQETHLSDAKHLKLKRDWVGEVYFSSFSSNKQGVAILIHKHFPFILEQVEKDPEGRFVLITGRILGKPLTVLNVYAPNEDSPDFISNMVLLFNHKCNGLGIMAGDFNCVMDGGLDRSSFTRSSARSSRTLQNICHASGLVDIWRELHPGVKDFTFYSSPHNSYSRLDYLFLPSGFVNCVRSCVIGPAVLSDHSPVYLDLTGFSTPKSSYWKFNSSLLNDNAFCQFLEEKIAQYWQDNEFCPVDSTTKWDAAKATLRGHIISFTTRRKKQKAENRRTLEEEVKRLELIHKFSPTQNNWNLLIGARSKLNYSEHVKKLVMFSRQRFYQFGNKPSHLLAYQL
ncbi:hypothetical protein C0J50_11822, partial [Silurus asotus]